VIEKNVIDGRLIDNSSTRTKFDQRKFKQEEVKVASGDALGANLRNSISRRSKSQAGQAMLESALILLPLLALSFALLDFSLAIFIQNTLRNATREGVRFAVTQQTGPGGQDKAITDVIMNNAFGFIAQNDLHGQNPVTTLTINYYTQANASTIVSGVGSNAAGNICVITVTINHAWMAPLWRATGVVPLSASSSDVMEAAPGGVLPGR